eukprot:Opistho-1_new@62062
MVRSMATARVGCARWSSRCPAALRLHVTEFSGGRYNGFITANAVFAWSSSRAVYDAVGLPGGTSHAWIPVFWAGGDLDVESQHAFADVRFGNAFRLPNGFTATLPSRAPGPLSIPHVLCVDT